MAASSQGKESSMPPITCSYSGNILYQERYQRTQRIHFALSRLKKCHRDYRAVAMFLSDTQTRVIWRHFDTQARVVWRSLWHLISELEILLQRCQFFFCWTSHKDTGCSDLCCWKTVFWTNFDVSLAVSSADTFDQTACNPREGLPSLHRARSSKGFDGTTYDEDSHQAS